MDANNQLEVLDIDYGIKRNVCEADKYVKWIADKIKFKNCTYYSINDGDIYLYAKSDVKTLSEANEKEWVYLIENEFYEGILTNSYKEVMKFYERENAETNKEIMQLSLF